MFFKDQNTIIFLHLLFRLILPSGLIAHMISRGLVISN